MMNGGKDMDAVLATIIETDDPMINLAKKVGAEAFKDMMDAIVGTKGDRVYVRSAASVFDKAKRMARDSQICLRFNGANIGQLALEYKISESRAREIIGAQ